MEQIAFPIFQVSTDADDALTRCPAHLREAAFEFRRTRDAALIPAILLRILEGHVGRDLLENLKRPDDRLRFSEDLGLDSLSMIEMTIVIEDVFAVAVGNAELRALRTLGDARRYIERAIATTAPA
jgi:3-hydroxyacyl-[acyl-carrier-protein] dehydratase